MTSLKRASRTNSASVDPKVRPTRIVGPCNISSSQAYRTGTRSIRGAVRSLALSILEDLDERARAKLVERDARPLDSLVLGDRAAVDRSQEVVEQALTCRGIVKDVADKR